MHFSVPIHDLGVRRRTPKESSTPEDLPFSLCFAADLALRCGVTQSEVAGINGEVLTNRR